MLRIFIAGLFLVLGMAGILFGGMRLYQPKDTGHDQALEVEAAVDAESVVTGARQPAQRRIDAPDIAAQSDTVLRRTDDGQDLSANAPEPVFGTSSAQGRQAQNKTSFQDRLYQVPVAYETPETVGVGASFDVTFAIDGTGDNSAADALSGQDTNRVEAIAKISDRLKASLVGSAFEIELLSPSVQRLSLLTENVWRWRVTPQREGEHVLTLELFALDGDEAIPVRTFRDTVTVHVSAFQRVLGVADTANPLFVLLGGIGSTIGGLFGFLRFFRRRG